MMVRVVHPAQMIRAKSDKMETIFKLQPDAIERAEGTGFNAGNLVDAAGKCGRGATHLG
ncbi:MAG: hypothetical protein RL333_1829 [Pseudomonadota bacterium]|jgi:hypothetical protein